MPSLYLITPHTKASLLAERIVITPLDDTCELSGKRSFPLIDIDLIVTSPQSHLSAQLISTLMERQIPITWLNNIGQLLGTTLSAHPPRGVTRTRQYELQSDISRQTNIATALIVAKIYNQRRVIQRLTASRQNAHLFQQYYLRCRRHIERLETPPLGIDHLLGIEGTSTAEFYQQYKTFFPEHFPFPKRSRRPPLDPPNAVLSFASTLIYQEMLVATHSAGLDTTLAHLHATSDDRHSLPLDLIEPLRPIIAEALTLDLFSRQSLSLQDFHPQNGGIYLTPDGRKKLILQYEKRLERHFHSEHLGRRTSLRAVIKNLPLQYKKHLTDNTPFHPFRMN